MADVGEERGIGGLEGLEFVVAETARKVETEVLDRQLS